MFIKFVAGILIIILFGFTGALSAQEPNWDWGGYIKDLGTWSDGVMTGFPVELGQWQNTVQLRLNMFLYPMDHIRATAQLRNIATYQKNIGQWIGFQELMTTNSYYFDLKWENTDEDLYLATEIDRLSLEWVYRDIQLAAGRQRIAWGTCLVWNPTDLFNPFNILDFDYEERPGTDAVSLQYYTGPVSQLDLAITPGRSRKEVIYAGRYQMNQWDYDFNLIAGWQRQSLRLGTSWAGAIYDGGFRGEILFTDPDMTFITFNQKPTGIQDLWITKTISRPYWTISLSYDYTFENSLYLHFEYLHNGLGATADAGYRQFEIIQTGELSPAKHSLFQEIAYQLTPLIRTGLFIIFNPNDHSWIAAPSIQYAAATNLELLFLAFPSGGEPGSEFGGYPDQYYARLKYSF